MKTPCSTFSVFADIGTFHGNSVTAEAAVCVIQAPPGLTDARWDRGPVPLDTDKYYYRRKSGSAEMLFPSAPIMSEKRGCQTRETEPGVGAGAAADLLSGLCCCPLVADTGPWQRLWLWLGVTRRLTGGMPPGAAFLAQK